jgi:hypothetical protein
MRLPWFPFVRRTGFVLFLSRVLKRLNTSRELPLRSFEPFESGDGRVPNLLGGLALGVLDASPGELSWKQPLKGADEHHERQKQRRENPCRALGMEKHWGIERNARERLRCPADETCDQGEGQAGRQRPSQVASQGTCGPRSPPWAGQ